VGVEDTDGDGSETKNKEVKVTDDDAEEFDEMP
jgi:hypothetical protein